MLFHFIHNYIQTNIIVKLLAMSFIPTAKGLVYNMDSFRAKRMLRIHALSACTHKHIFAYIHLVDTPQRRNIQYFRVWL